MSTSQIRMIVSDLLVLHKQVGRFLTIQRYPRVTDHGLNFAEVIVNTVPRGGPTTEASLLFISNDMQDVIFSKCGDLMYCVLKRNVGQRC